MSTTTPPGGIDQDLLQEKISQMLERNGTLTDKEWRQLTVYFMQDIRQDVKEMRGWTPRIKKLEEKNLIMLIEKHPKISGIIITAIILATMFFHEVSPWVIKSLASLAGIALP